LFKKTQNSVVCRGVALENKQADIRIAAKQRKTNRVQELDYTLFKT